MIAHLVLAVALVPDLPVLRSAPGVARFVRMVFDVTTYGVRGKGVIVVDRVRGRYVRRTVAGPISDAEGFDGARAWRADATGMPRIEGNADERGAIVAWSYLLARAPHPARQWELAVPSGERGARLRYAALSRAVDVVAGARSGLVDRITLRVGQSAETTSFSDYRTVGDLVVPFAMFDRSDSGDSVTRVRTVEFPAAVGDRVFAPPPVPHDFTLTRTTTIRTDAGSRGIVVPVRINGAAPVMLGLDTGGQNVISRAAARRLGLRTAGGASAGGVGAGRAAVSFAFARSVRVGGAEMRDQPFLILDLPAGFDGLVGYELLARFAARLNFRAHRLDLAPESSAFGSGGVAVPIAFDDKQPQANGAIDGIPGVLTIDTGSDGWVDVRTPFIRAHHLIERYRPRVSGRAFFGIGGAVRASLAMAKTIRIGDATLHRVVLRLVDAKSGAEINPSVAANVGDEVLRRFVVVFDYRRATMRLLPGGDPAPLRWADRSGLRVAPDGTNLRVTNVLTGTPAGAAGIRIGDVLAAVDGHAVAARDAKRVARALNAAPGTVVALTLRDGRRVALRLRDYFPR